MWLGVGYVYICTVMCCAVGTRSGTVRCLLIERVVLTTAQSFYELLETPDMIASDISTRPLKIHKETFTYQIRHGGNWGQ